MHWNILDNKRQSLLPLLHTVAGDNFYLAGGTGLALYFGHRDSVDFDFFTASDMNTIQLFQDIEKIFAGHRVIKTQEENNTLGIVIDDTVKISFMTYSYPLIHKTTETEHFPIASIIDIACMKFSAITSRATNKDYIDIYFVLQQYSLQELLDACAKKFPTIDTGLVLKSLVYFDDVTDEPIIYKENHDTDFAVIKEFLKKEVVQLYT